MIKGRLYMHERGMDCGIEAIDVYPDGRVLGRWVNFGYTGKPWYPGNKRYPFFQNKFLPKIHEWRDVTNLINTPRGQWPK